MAVRISWMTPCRSSTDSDKPLLDLGRSDARDRALHAESDREQALDDVVVQVPGDPVAVGQDVEFAHLTLSGGQLPGQRSLIGEGGHRVELVVGEGRCAEALAR